VSRKKKLAPGKRAAGAKPIHAAPQWLIEALRPPITFGSRLLWRIRLKGVENIPQNTGLIVAANHQSYGDPFWLSIPIKTPTRYLAWSEAFQWPLVGTAIGLLGAWPLQVEGADPAAIRRSLNWLREGGALVIFPEGGRGLPDGTMIRMKGGAVRMALEAEVPILPVTIRGANQVWPSHKRLPRRGQVEIIYHPVMHVQQRADEDPKRCARRETDRLADIIRSAL
jgi:1-acyl-sn-glycerol-3-phosphate acyltransferase